ncbi:MAG TPA: APC family permease [Planctomycetota bacterium]|nr:APC family permease [Planctomycetota bacterium]
MKLKEWVLGAPKSPLDPHVFEKLALAAFLAWVGLGADGLSSSCYGPEEIFKALGQHRALAPFLILAIAVTVSVLSAGYAHTIEAFPGGGGGYIVASKTLGRYPGLLCGCALLVDYVLTIAISIAAGVEALFSAFPRLHAFRLPAILLATVGLMVLNLRGVKESIKVLLPIFFGFLITHTAAIIAALATHPAGIGEVVRESTDAAAKVTSTAGLGALLLVLLKAYTVGAGTYTGIEAISNTVPMLREPRVATAKRAMLYMAVSLAFTSGGLLLGYLLLDVRSQPHMTFNAVFLQNLTQGTVFSGWFAPLTLFTETALLFVAAQAGYISGPRAMASMAVDSWIPRWFRHLSDRLVISNGVLLVGLGSVVTILLTRGSVHLLVVIYAFSVFVTFVLSQLGMALHHVRLREPGWIFRFCVNGLAFLLSAIIVVAMTVQRFHEGVLWSGVVIAGLMAVCLLVHYYYSRVGILLRRLESVRVQVESEPPRGEAPSAADPRSPTAVVLVRSYSGAGIHTLMAILRNFPNYFKNFVFLSVGDIDFDRFKGAAEVERLRESVRSDLEKYVALVRKWGYWGEYRVGMGVDVVDEATEMCAVIAREHPRAMFFAGQLVFEQPSIITRILHEQTGPEIQRRLQFEGRTLILLPIRVLIPLRSS